MMMTRMTVIMTEEINAAITEVTMTHQGLLKPHSPPITGGLHVA